MKKNKIILIEDDKTLAYLLNHKLTLNGLEILCFDNFIDAKLYIENKLDSINVIISDYILPDCNGIQILNWVRIEMKSQVKFIMISTFNSQDLILQFYECKGDYFFEKPLNYNNIIEICSK